MARVRPLVVARNLSGRVVPGAENYFYERDPAYDYSADTPADHAQTEIDVFASPVGGSPLTQPILTDDRGYVEECWMAPQPYDRRIKYVTDDYIVPDEAWALGDGVIERDMGAASLLSDYEHAFSTYKTLERWTNYSVAGAVVYGFYLHTPQTNDFGVGGVAGDWAAAFPFDPADYDAGGRDVKLRLRGRIWVESDSPGVGRTVQPFMAYVENAPAGARQLGVYSDVPDSRPAAQTIAASQTYTFDTGDFAAPGAGAYVVGVSLAGGAMAAGAFFGVTTRLLMRQT